MVTIGIPVYNEEKFIETTLKSVIDNLAYIDKVIISDNASTDNTSFICQKYSTLHNKIVYIRHDENLGSLKNFTYTLNMADTKYFMWLGGHDVIPKNYIDSLLKAYKKTPDAVLAYAPVERIGLNGEFISFYEYFFSKDLASEDPFLRVYSLVKNSRECAIIHGLFKKELLKHSVTDEAFIGPDHIILSKMAVLGKFVYTTETKFQRRIIREETPNDKLLRWSKNFGITKLDSNPYEKRLIYTMDVMGKIEGNKTDKTMWELKLREELLKQCSPNVFQNIMQSRIQKVENGIDKVVKYFQHRNIFSIGIYGAGTVGKLLFEKLNQKIDIRFFVDERLDLEYLNDIPVIKSNKIISSYSVDAIIISVLHNDDYEIESSLSLFKSINIIRLRKILELDSI